MWFFWLSEMACLTSETTDEISELRERIAVLEAGSGNSNTSEVSLTDIEARLSSLEDGYTQTNEQISYIETSIESIEDEYALLSHVEGIDNNISILDQRIESIESSIGALQSNQDLITSQILTLQTESALTSLEVDTILSDILSIQNRAPQVFQTSGSYSAYISSSAWTTLSGSELPMAIPYSGVLMVSGSFSVTGGYCFGTMTVEVVDSASNSVGTGSVMSFGTNSTYTSASFISSGSMNISVSGNYTARLRYNGGSNGGGSCNLTTYQTNAVFIANPS